MSLPGFRGGVSRHRGDRSPRCLRRRVSFAAHELAWNWPDGWRGRTGGRGDGEAGARYGTHAGRRGQRGRCAPGGRARRGVGGAWLGSRLMLEVRLVGAMRCSNDKFGWLPCCLDSLGCKMHLTLMQSADYHGLVFYILLLDQQCTPFVFYAVTLSYFPVVVVRLGQLRGTISSIPARLHLPIHHSRTSQTARSYLPVYAPQ